MKMFYFVELTLKPQQREALLSNLQPYAVDVRREEGCECLDILVDPLLENVVYLYEIWSSESAQLGHLNSPGFAEWKVFSDPLITNFEVKTLNSAE